MAKPSKTSTPAPIESSTVAEPPPHARLVLALICFLAGAAIMVIEISAYRLLAPLFGNSAFTWTALIGVILMAFSAGGYLGGWLAEKKSDFALLGWLLAGASVLTLFVPAIHALVSPSFEQSSGLIAGPLSVSLLLFVLPGILLGAVSPASVRLYSLLGRDAHVGVSAGTISMLGSLGSFAGTLVCGFYLLSNFGVRSIFIGTGITLLVLAGLAFFLARNPLQAQLPIWLAGLVAALIGGTVHGSIDANVIYRQDSYYHRIEVREEGHGEHTRRYLKLDSTWEGGMKVSDGSIVMEYQQFWQLATMKPGFEVKRALFLGAGAFAMPEQLSKKFPNAIIDVVEIDPQVVQVGRDFFKLNDFPNVHAYASDARRFLRGQIGVKYDFVFGDAYHGREAIPLHLASKEFFAMVHEHLTPDGIFVMNVISSLRGPCAELLGGMIATLQDVYPNVDVLSASARDTTAGNMLLLASNTSWSPLFTERTYSQGSIHGGIAASYISPREWPTGGVIFTDDRNPVDDIIARSLWQQ